TVTGTGTPPTRPLTSSLITPSLLEQTKFFLTASSRAPDVNMFNQPRVICWPINASTTQRTLYDSTIAWCGTLNSAPLSQYVFYFQRSRDDHHANDLPAAPLAAGGGKGNLARNRNLINYLANLTSQPIPGFGGNFLTKYPSVSNVTPSGGSANERDQILT